jgi:hypothetical protein
MTRITVTREHEQEQDYTRRNERDGLDAEVGDRGENRIVLLTPSFEAKS